MPTKKRKNITGREHRERDRSRKRLKEKPSRKIALRDQNPESNYLGEMNRKCDKCEAIHCACEKSSSGFQSCCHNGKIDLPSYIPSEYIQNLLDCNNAKSEAY